jgi:hypothetical protein
MGYLEQEVIHKLVELVLKVNMVNLNTMVAYQHYPVTKKTISQISTKRKEISCFLVVKNLLIRNVLVCESLGKEVC